MKNTIKYDAIYFIADNINQSVDRHQCGNVLQIVFQIPS